MDVVPGHFPSLKLIPKKNINKHMFEWKQHGSSTSGRGVNNKGEDSLRPNHFFRAKLIFLTIKKHFNIVGLKVVATIVDVEQM